MVPAVVIDVDVVQVVRGGAVLLPAVVVAEDASIINGTKSRRLSDVSYQARSSSPSPRRRLSDVSYQTRSSST